MAHTKGPWRVFIAGSEGCRILPDTGDKREDLKSIAMVNGRDFSTDADNAVLIAAAPDLLEALKLLLDEHQNLVNNHASENGISNGSDLWPELGVARRAIAKAEPK